MNQKITSISFDQIKVNIASPDQIKLWSYGEVKKPETINYRTFKPEKDGLFCSKIFGPIKDYECLCGKYKRLKYRGVICEKCGVEVIQAKVRRDRMGHIELVSPVVHIWYLKSLPSYISILLDMSLRNIEQILYFELYVIIDQGSSPANIKDLLTEDQLLYYTKKYKKLKVLIGAEAIEFLLLSLNLQDEIKKIKQEITLATSFIKFKKLNMRLRLCELFKKSGNKPEWMIIRNLPVLPPDLRPLVPLDGGRFAASDLNDLYRRVINRNTRLKKLLILGAPDIIVRNEKRMLQEAVDSLLDNGRGGKSITGSNRRPLKSLSSMLKGKQGRFRQNLLGKRVDYSGRSVIVSGPTLKLYQCGLPKKMALELFKPLIYSKLGQLDHAVTIQSAKKIVEEKHLIVWDILYKITKEYPILLNRAPTLHRLGIQAFEPILVDGKAIQLHPLVCLAFNADFDGDQMAVHIPLTLEAQLEARVLMMSINNILSPASGMPILTPTQDIVLGLYYLSLNFNNFIEYNQIYVSINHVFKDYFINFLSLHSIIRVRIKQKILLFTGKYYTIVSYVLTTVGRLILYNILPEGISISFVDKALTKYNISIIVLECYQRLGSSITCNFLDKLMYTGYYYSTISGISISIEDMVIPKNKNINLAIASTQVKDIISQYLNGLITLTERYNKIIDIWVQTNTNISQAMLLEISESFYTTNSIINSIYIMSDSGSRGSASQIQQLAGMRGLMSRPDGSILETPIISNFREGLSVLEYFISTHGARKGLADTALKTSNSGYLTRRLVDVAQDLVISEYDCFNYKGVEFLEFDHIDSKKKQYFVDRIFGRVLAEPIYVKNSNIILASINAVIDNNIITKIIKYNIMCINIRSVITCGSKVGVCSLCYGIDLSKRCLINIGEAIGIIAAQSIGEPGTQLTMRTFHVGGIISKTTVSNKIQSHVSGFLKYGSNFNFLINNEKKKIVVSNYSELIIYDFNLNILIRRLISYGSFALIDNYSFINKLTILCEWDPYFVPIISEYSGYVYFFNFVEGLTVKTIIDRQNSTQKIIITSEYCKYEDKEYIPKICIRKNKYLGNHESLDNIISYTLNIGTILIVSNFCYVRKGTILAKISQENIKNKDITGGLSKVVDLFEARKSKNSVILATISGIIKFGRETKGRRKIIIINSSKNILVELLISKWRQLSVYEGKFVQQGDVISEGTEDLNQILNVRGIQKLTNYLINQIQIVYKSQGVQINCKHIEVILRQMLHVVTILDKGDSNFINGEKIKLSLVKKINENLKQKSNKLIIYGLLLLGITKASLATDSFLSAASFQETTKVLTEAAVAGKIDLLVGLKENVLLGRLIPSGTGLFFYLNKRN